MAEAFRAWDDIDHPRAWVATVARREFYRQRAHEVPVDFMEIPDSGTLLMQDSPGDEFERLEARILQDDLLRRLSPAEREIMTMHVLGFRFEEIASMLGRNPATVRSFARNARARLRRMWVEAERDDA